jgi:hypothetical protein
MLPPGPLPPLSQDELDYGHLINNLLMNAKTLPINQEISLVNETLAQKLQRYLAYTCNLKKHKGKTWGHILNEDYGYFCWAVTNRLDKSRKTYSVLSVLVQ